MEKLKTKIYDLAKELNTTSKRLMEKLAEINIAVKNHMSSLEPEELEALYKHIGVISHDGKKIEADDRKTPPPQTVPKVEARKEVKDTKKDAKSLPRIIRKTEIVINTRNDNKESKDYNRQDQRRPPARDDSRGNSRGYQKQDFFRMSDDTSGLRPGFVRDTGPVIKKDFRSAVKTDSRMDALKSFGKNEVKLDSKVKQNKPVEGPVAKTAAGAGEKHADKLLDKPEKKVVAKTSEKVNEKSPHEDVLVHGKSDHKELPVVENVHGNKAMLENESVRKADVQETTDARPKGKGETGAEIKHIQTDVTVNHKDSAQVENTEKRKKAEVEAEVHKHKAKDPDGPEVMKADVNEEEAGKEDKVGLDKQTDGKVIQENEAKAQINIDSAGKDDKNHKAEAKQPADGLKGQRYETGSTKDDSGSSKDDGSNQQNENKASEEAYVQSDAPHLDSRGGSADSARTDTRKSQGDRLQSQADRPRNDRPRSDRQQGERSQGDRAQGERSQGDRTQGDRAQGDRQQGDRAQGDRPQGERAQGERPWSDRPRYDRSQGDKQRSDRSQGDRPQGERPQGERAQGERPWSDRPRYDRPQGDRSQGDRPQGERPWSDRPRYDRPQGDRPQGERPWSDRPRSDRPQGDRPQGERPWSDRPRYDRPQGDRPQGERPWSDRPQGDRQQGDRPWSDRPQGDRQQGDRTWSDRPQGDRPQGDRQWSDRSQYDGRRDQGDRSQREAPYNRQGQRPGAGRPASGFRTGRPLEIPKPELTDAQKDELGAQRSEVRREFQNKDSDKDIKREQKRELPKAAVVPEKAKKFKPQKVILNEKKGVSEILSDDFLLEDLFTEDNVKKTKKPVQKARKDSRVEHAARHIPPARAVLTNIQIPENITVKDLAEALKKTSTDVIKKFMNMGLMVTLNQEIDFDTAAIIAEEYNVKAEKALEVNEEDILFDESEEEADNLVPRPPVVVVMGHVDHGKTSLLDAIRETNVIDSEAGGITQHIGAYTVRINNRNITFLDTPGHEAFTAMRARGAQVTDIAILVVAADDGIMPQTIEAINHAKAANVGIIVAINKIDKPGSNPEKIKQELTEYGLVAEEWGGDVICVPISAKKKLNIDHLLEMVLLAADMLELKSNPDKQAKGTIIEARLDKDRGPLATVLVQRGTLNVGDSIVTGTTVGRIRAMADDKGHKIKKAGPSTPAEILGLPDVPEAGEIFYAITDEKIAKQLAEKRRTKLREQQLKSPVKVSLDDLFNQIKEGKVKELNIIVKADVQGSVEAVKQSFEKLSNDEVRVKIVHGGVGAITESDVTLALVSNAIITGFNVRPGPNVSEAAQNAGVDLRLYRVIYNAIEDIQAAMKGMLEPTFKEVILGHVEIRQIFKVSGIGTVGGCYVTDGKIGRNSDIRLVRDGIVIHEGKLASLKRFKDDVKEVNEGFECGLSIEKFNDIKEGDVVESFTMEEVAR